MNANEIIIPCRVSYEHVWEPESVNGSDPKYSLCCIIPKSDTATIAKLQQLIGKVKQDGIGKWGGKIPATLKIPLRDGDVDHPEDENYKGAMFLNANNDRQPSIIDRHCQPVMDRDEVYSGCYANVKLKVALVQRTQAETLLDTGAHFRITGVKMTGAYAHPRAGGRKPVVELEVEAW